MLPLFFIAVAFAAGILIADLLPISIWVWVGFGFLGIAFFILSRIYSRLPLPFLKIEKALHLSPAVLLIFLCLGGCRYALSLPHWTTQNLAWYNDRGSYTFVGVVDAPPDRREDAVYLRVKVRELYNPASMTYLRVTGTAQVRMDKAADWQLGDLLRFTASPKTPFENEDFSYRAYLDPQGIYTVIYFPTSVDKLDENQVDRFWLILDKLRRRASKTIYALLPQPESSLLEGILLGNDNNLPDSVKQAYQATGTAHIIAISGFNMTVLAGLFLTIFSRPFNRYRATWITLLILFVYTLFVGSSPSVMRALIMAVIAYSGRLFGRKGGGLNALGLAAAVMLGINPKLLWDASFQLSFGATFGLIVFAGPFADGLQKLIETRFSEETAARLSGPVNDNLLMSLAAQITTLPIVAMQFKRFSLTSLLANPLVLPVQQIILVFGMVTTFIGMLWTGAGKVLAALLWPLLAYSNRMVEGIAGLQNSSVTLSGSAAVWISLIAIIVVIAGIIYIYRMKWLKKNWFPILFVVLALAAALTWTAVLRRPDGSLHLSLIRAEDGTALFLRSPNGETLVIDPQGGANTLATALSQSIPPYNFHLDAAFLTTHESVKALSALNDRLPVSQAVLAPSVYHLTDEETPLSLPEGMEIKELQEGESLLLDGAVQIRVLASDSQHAALLLSYGDTCIFIPNGLEPAAFKPYRSSSLRGLSALILSDADVANLPADMWQNYGSRTILWNSTAVSPDPDWPGLDTYSQINLIIDPTQVSLNLQKP
jgi:competence protein ComEC